jgi:Ca2+-binding EF-hand superfamily protein
MLASLGNHELFPTDCLGLDASPTTVENMFSVMPHRLDFPAFLTHITSQLSLFSSRDQLTGAFTAFDEKDIGFIDYNELTHNLTQSGPQRLREEQVDGALSGFVERVGKNKGKLSYGKLMDAMLGDQKQSKIA